MDWKKHYEIPRIIKKIKELKIGDLISYYNVGSNSKRFTVIRSIELKKTLWGYFYDTKKETIKKPGIHDLKSYIKFNDNEITLEQH